MIYSNFLKLAFTIGELKRLKRKGWVRHNVKNPETVAEHSFRTAVLALVLSADLKIDREKIISMALVHDLAESVVGDITPFDGISKKEKHQKELEAMKKISKDSLNSELLTLFKEYSEGTSKEAVFVKEMDNLELMIQAHEYENHQLIDLQEFWDYSKNYKFKIASKIFKELENLRKNKK